MPANTQRLKLTERQISIYKQARQRQLADEAEFLRAKQQFERSQLALQLVGELLKDAHGVEAHVRTDLDEKTFELVVPVLDPLPAPPVPPENIELSTDLPGPLPMESDMHTGQ